MKITSLFSRSLAVLATGLMFLPSLSSAEEAKSAVKPLKALLICGGCCHDYTKQKNILSAGISARANVEWTLFQDPDNSTKHKVELYSSPDWAKGYDVVVHDECFSDIKDLDFIRGIVKAHADGVPGVNLHCAMHCYRTAADVGHPVKAGTDDSIWFDYIGIQSSGHGAQKPIVLTFTQKDSPILKGLTEWTTINEELYNNIQVFNTTLGLVKGKQDAGDHEGQNNNVVVWTHEYGPKKTRIFSTTLGHNNETVGSDNYLNLVTNGLLWACSKLGDDGKPASGYEAQKAAGK